MSELEDQEIKKASEELTNNLLDKYPNKSFKFYKHLLTRARMNIEETTTISR